MPSDYQGSNLKCYTQPKYQSSVRENKVFTDIQCLKKGTSTCLRRLLRTLAEERGKTGEKSDGGYREATQKRGEGALQENNCRADERGTIQIAALRWKAPGGRGKERWLDMFQYFNWKNFYPYEHENFYMEQLEKK